MFFIVILLHYGEDYRVKLTTQHTMVMNNNELTNTLEELKKQELIFQHPPVGITRVYLENMIAPTFWEVGASGQCYNREHAITVLIDRLMNQPTKDRWQSKDFQCTQIAQDHYLLTYTVIQGSRISRRASLWRRTQKNWSILYHQGTLVQK